MKNPSRNSSERSNKIIDFGLGKMAGQTRVTGGMSALKGATASYEAPEYRIQALRKDRDHLLDQYSLGMVGFKLLTASLPKETYSDEKKWKFARHWLKKFKVSPSVQNTLLKMLSIESSRRFPSLSAAREALHAPPKTPGWMTGAAAGLIIGSLGMAFLSGASKSLLSYSAAVLAFVILIVNLLWDWSLSGAPADEKSSKSPRARQGALFSMMVLLGLVQLMINMKEIGKEKNTPAPKVTIPEKPLTERPKDDFDSLYGKASRALSKGEYQEAETFAKKALTVRGGRSRRLRPLSQSGRKEAFRRGQRP